jgi:class 3 adenylate cyclase/predicted ATPase
MARVCPNCAAAARPDAKFCDECGTPLGASTPRVPAALEAAATTENASAERRLVSVLFADLVGFTPLSEKRDAEDVRDLLTRYFDTARAVVGRYGGTVEKFIGDAVMAVWGAPTTHEDDAERAVRAALDLVDAVAELGGELGSADLQARAGVLTGKAAVTFGSEAQGMVAGDLVNTASRIQGAAAPGTVLVGDATQQATEAAVAYEDAGEHTLKGKAEPIRLWRAVRVVAGRGGALKSEGLEAPFVGRERELRLIKDLFHTSAEHHKANLVSVVGIAGIGKSRLLWEFFKYIDGLAEQIRWHRGRCLAYGEGVTYWALAEMVRMRARIVEGEDAASAKQKLQQCLVEHVPDSDERRWVEPRLAQLLALEDGVTQEREELFSAWRLFFERLADVRPTVLVFEDMQWADTSLLEFIEYLLEWSRNHPLYVLTAGRPELVDRHPTWGAGKRNFTSLYLEPLAPAAMEQLMDGLVPGLPDEVREQILRRAEGVPLYAVETVRMLLDRGLLTRAGSVYRITGAIEDLAVPQSLQGLIAARLDGLKPESRRVLQDAAVLGKTFTVPSLAAVSAVSTEELEPMLVELVRKEVLSLQADPRSPERGQYGFLQDLVKRVAYETLSKRDRKERHLAVAAWFESGWGGEEGDVVEVVASHYLEAYNLAPQDPDAEQIKERASAVLCQAGERAASLAANAEAERYFDQAAQLAVGVASRAELHERAGHVAWRAGRADTATAHYERAIALYDAERMTHAAARVSAYLGRVISTRGQVAEAIDRMERAFQVLEQDPPDADLATLAEVLGTIHFFTGDGERATQRIEKALDIAEGLWLPETISRALNTKGLIAQRKKHREEGLALLTHALKVALDNDLGAAAMRAYFNRSDALVQADRYAEALGEYRNCLAMARKVGDRVFERSAQTEIAWVLCLMSEWDEALAMATQMPDAEVREAANECLSLLSTYAEICVHRGDRATLERMLGLFARLEHSADMQERGVYLTTQSTLLRMNGECEAAFRFAEEGLRVMDQFGSAHQIVKLAFVQAMEAALALDDFDKTGGVLDVVASLGEGERPPLINAHATRFRARIAARQGDGAAPDAMFASAVEQFREIGTAIWLAIAQLEHAEWLAGHGHEARAMQAAEAATQTFVRMQAQPWIERAQRLVAVPVAS